MPIKIDLRENALIKDLIAEVRAEWELKHAPELKAIEQVVESEKAKRLQAEQEHQKRLQAKQEAEEDRQRINNMILALYQEFQMPIEQIAKIANHDPSYIKDLITQAAARDDKK